MSIIFKSNGCSFLDHNNYIFNIYKNIPNNAETYSYALSAKLFYILNNVHTVNRKRSKRDSSDDLHEEATKVRLKYERFLLEMEPGLKDKLCNNSDISNMKAVRDFSRELLERTAFTHVGTNGGNNSERSVRCNVENEEFLIPYNSRFYCSCVIKQCHELAGYKYDIVIADPPWWNKYIRRLKGANNKLSYSMMYNEDIASIPLKTLLADNSIVAVWCTNSPSNITAVKNLIFPSWGVEYVATWYWMKVDIQLKPLCPFSTGSKKQPYERLIIGKVGEVNHVPDDYLFMSVPSALHSHKPPLIDLLKEYVKKENPDILELFARYLLPNTTSVGYEPLKLQHISLYEVVS
ncbi:N(6)-adenine-specific methyltransferase METTL4 [Galleria mellonella]|uniref:N(6)-adenine-specific methyltransferase METTL4 n=1 Tax=Galleria mellonella TaxID=7137 RepID=A0A6J3BWC6_GALME|nr:N(6)-adenine-specific methyltransferase METTL4 [Galleria mellonella]